MKRLLFLSLLALSSPAQAGTPTKCLPASVKAKLNYIERHFGRVTVISTYRKNARIAGSGKPSKHRFCGAADFHVKGNKAAAIRWLWKQRGEVILYSGHFHHIHIAEGNWKGRKR